MTYCGKYVLLATNSVTNNGTISVFDGQTGVTLNTLNCENFSDNSIAIIQDFVIGCVEKKSLLEMHHFSSDGKKKVISLPATAKAVVYNDIRNIVACFLGFDVYIWQPSTGRLLTILGKVHSHPGSEILFTNKNIIITVDESGLIVVWRLDLIEFCEVLWKSRPIKNCKIFCHLTIMDELVVVGNNGQIITLSLFDGCPTRELIDLALPVHCIAGTHPQVYLGCSNSTMTIFDHMKNKVTHKRFKYFHKSGNCDITHIVVTPDRRSIIAVFDRSLSLTLNIYMDFSKSCFSFSLGQNVNNLQVIPKEVYQRCANQQGKSTFLIKRLNFSLDDAVPDYVEVRLRPKNPLMTAKEILERRDSSLDEFYSAMMTKLKENSSSDTKGKELLRNLKKR